MARIRSIKPSIWTDERFIGLSRDARLLCIGMISHADDEGRLLATAARLSGDIFPADEIRPGAILGWRGEIEQCGLIEIYTVRGVEYARFPRWGKHQRISKPQPSVLPGPATGPERGETRNGSTPSRGTTPRPPPERVHDEAYPSRAEARARLGDRRQETGVPPSAGAERAAVAERIAESDDTAQTLVAEWIDHVPKRPPGSVVAQVGKHLRAMLGEGIEATDLRRGLALWAGKGLHPSALPSVVNEAMNGRASPPPRQSTTDQRVAAGLALAAQLDAEHPPELTA